MANERGGEGNFANDPQRASEAGKKGGEHSHRGQQSQGQQGGGQHGQQGGGQQGQQGGGSQASRAAVRTIPATSPMTARKRVKLDAKADRASER